MEVGLSSLKSHTVGAPGASKSPCCLWSIQTCLIPSEPIVQGPSEGRAPESSNISALCFQLEAACIHPPFVATLPREIYQVYQIKMQGTQFNLNFR